MLSFLLLALFAAVALGALPHGLTAAQIGNAKKQCQANCAHVSSKGRDVVLHNRCVQQCWNDFFQSVTEGKTAPHQQPQQHHGQHQVNHHKPPVRQTARENVKVFRNVAHDPKRSVLHRGRGAPAAGSQLQCMGMLALGLLIAVFAL